MPTPEEFVKSERAEGDIGDGGSIVELFWNGDYPFIADAEKRRIDWTDTGLAAVAYIATSFFDAWADAVGAFYQSTLITPIETYSGQVVVVVETITGGVAGLFQFAPAIDLASSTGFLGALVILVVGYLIVSNVVGRLR